MVDVAVPTACKGHEGHVAAAVCAVQHLSNPTDRTSYEVYTSAHVLA